MSNEISLQQLVEQNAINTLLPLLESGSAIDAVDDEGRTALHKAAYNGYDRLVKLLLIRGANKNIKDNAGYNALYYALQAGHSHIINLLQNPNTYKDGSEYE